MSNNRTAWKIWIDTGGTFTDCIAISPQGQLQRIKVLSSSQLRGRLLERLGPGTYRVQCNWPPCGDIFVGYRFSWLGQSLPSAQIVDTDLGQEVLRLSQDLPLPAPAEFEITAGEEAPVLALRLATQTPLGTPLPPVQMRLGTTKGTNALLEDKGARTALLITRGFGDLLTIGNQQRPELFQLAIPPARLLCTQVIEVDERLDAQGRVLHALSEVEIARILTALDAARPAAVAVALLHSYRNPVHEEQLAAALRQAGYAHISLSQALAPTIKLLPRAQAAAVNAYLAPIMEDYLGNIRQALGPQQLLHVMSSAGGLAQAGLFHPKDSLLSGPAGGVVGAAAIARQLGFRQILTFDMGGTSTDTACYDGQYDYAFTTQVAGVEMSSPCLAIETVAAGGGSICWFDGHKLQVGPASAGASPGPACYGAGGPLCITDVNLLLGKLDPALMGIPIDEAPARQALLALCQQVEQATGQPHSAEQVLRGLERIANEKMADAIRRISVAKGLDPADYALLSFGGAGGLHACQIAALLGIRTIIMPYDAGLLSAYGMGQAQIERLVGQQVLEPLSACQGRLPAMMARLEHQAIQMLRDEGLDEAELEIRARFAYLRFVGQDSVLEVPYQSAEGLQAAFQRQYTTLFGHYPADRAVEVESIKAVAATRAASAEGSLPPEAFYRPLPQGERPAPFTGQPIPCFHWEALREGAQIDGPALLLHRSSTAFIEAGWSLQMYGGGHAVLRQHKAPGSLLPSEQEQVSKAVELELFTNRFAAIAEEMGAQLQRTAFSVNVKERLDFSCAVLGPDARLLANAPHIPVHLGSLGVCARLMLAKRPLGPGDVLITNHPKYGGSHLPDVTLLSAAFTAEGQLIGYLINRAHHAEIGGTRPGSMPPDARTLEEEGVAILPMYLARAGQVAWQEIEAILTQAPWPTRALPENLADINAALAALKAGEAALQKLAATHGLEKVHRYMQGLQDSATASLAQALQNRFAQTTFTAEERLDDGRPIKLKITLKNGQIHLDFTGTGGPHPHNLNANLSIVHSALIYVLRLICQKNIPLNEGLMARVQIELPPSFLHPPFHDEADRCPAVSGGNTEVSQRLVDALLKAFGLAACSQGTMNNFLFGNERFGYYETIGGGAGAGPGFAGRSAVHTHMTNTRITDPEELEFRYPVRLHRFALRPGSGGAGRWHGGHGIIREVEFTQPVAITILSQHRQERPYGLEGGSPGLPGRQYLIHPDGRLENLAGIDSRTVPAGCRIIIETPGGGGWGGPLL
jgi:5-oxoprolinase (ATP-hydrolysing)